MFCFSLISLCGRPNSTDDDWPMSAAVTRVVSGVGDAGFKAIATQCRSRTKMESDSDKVTWARERHLKQKNLSTNNASVEKFYIKKGATGTDRVEAGRPAVHMSTPDRSAVPRWAIPPVFWRRGPSASLLRFDIIACCPTYSCFSHPRSSFSGRRFQTVEHSAAERHIGVVTDLSACRLISSVATPNPL